HQRGRAEVMLPPNSVLSPSARRDARPIAVVRDPWVALGNGELGIEAEGELAERLTARAARAQRRLHGLATRGGFDACHPALLEMELEPFDRTPIPLRDRVGDDTAYGLLERCDAQH